MRPVRSCPPVLGLDKVEAVAGWARDGLSAVKMKVGRDAARDIERVALARTAIGPGTDLYVDANGAYARIEAMLFDGAVTAGNSESAPDRTRPGLGIDLGIELKRTDAERFRT